MQVINERRGRSVCQTLVYQKQFQGQRGVLHDFNITFADGTTGVYTAKDANNPKFRPGQESDYIAKTVATKNGTQMIKITYPSEKSPSTESRQKPNKVSALEWARKLYNSTQDTKNPMTTEGMLKVADLFISMLNQGVNRDAIDTAVIIQCKVAVNHGQINSNVMKTQIQQFDAWIKSR